MAFPMKRLWFIALVFGAAHIASADGPIDPALLNQLEWRSIGPAVMGGRISDIDAVPGDPANVFVAAGSGGLFRTLDGGMTWTPIFERQATLSIGAIAVQPGNPKVIWVGTGESNVRNSVSFGDGVYKSIDGGASWTRVGLENTETISRIVINPENPDNVFVAALGHPFGPNPDRGIFVTEDGGRSWRKTLYIDEEHGAADVDLDPSNPKIVYAGMWHFDRKPWTYTSGSEKGGVFQSVDGGATWKRLTNGLPKLMGRIGVKVAPSNPNVVYVIAESKEGTLFRSDDRGASFKQISDDRELIGRGYYFTDMRVVPDAVDHLMVLADALLESKDGGKHFRRASPSVHGDEHALWIDPKNPQRMWQGNDGGLAVTYDGAQHWEQINNIPLGQFYRVSADDRQPFYQLTAGMQDNGMWTGPSRTRELAGIFNDDWRMVTTFVGFGSLSDPDNPDILLTEQSGGALVRTDLQTREQQIVSPQPKSYAGAPAREMKYRFGWDAPLVRSPFGKRTVYFAGNVIFQSSDYGKSWEAISHDLTSNDASKEGNIGGPVSVDNSASEVYSTISALAESPKKRGVLWAGTDDGNLQVTLNGGGEWTNVAANVHGVAAKSRVSSVEPSRASALTAYASFDRHMFDDFRPYIFKTIDGGKSWTSITRNLPEKAFVWTVKEDPREPRLLYAGTELGIYASFSGGEDWIPLHLKNMPWSVAVRDIILSPEDDLVVATHGRSLWVLDDVMPLRALAHGDISTNLFPVRPAFRFAMRPTHFGFGDKTFTGPNPSYGALINYFAAGDVKDLKVQIVDASGAVVRNIPSPGQSGLHRVAWDLRYAGAGGRQARGPQAVPGHYVVRMIADGKSYEQGIDIKMDPAVNVSADDLKAAYDVTSHLVQMQAAANGAIAKLNAVRGQHPQEVEALLDRLTRPANLRSETGPRLKENLDALFTMIDGADAAPTAAQMNYYGELRTEFQDVMQQVNALADPAQFKH